MSDIGTDPDLPGRLAEGTGRSVLSLPLTPFTEDGSFTPEPAHLEEAERLLDAGLAPAARPARR